MFAPLGFVQFESIIPLIMDVADDHITQGAFIGPPDRDDSELAEAGRSVMHVWLMARLLNVLDVAICSPDGRVLRAAPMLLFHEDLIGNVAFEWWPREETKMESLWLHAIECRPEITYLDRFRFINTITWTIDASPERLTHVRNLGLVINEDVEPQCRIAAHFDGWALCVEEARFPASVEDIYTAIGATLTAEQEERATGRKGGRPELKGQAHATFSRLFPRGRGDTPWKEVEEQVALHLGRRISARTIKRSLGQAQVKSV